MPAGPVAFGAEKSTEPMPGSSTLPATVPAATFPWKTGPAVAFASTTPAFTVPKYQVLVFVPSQTYTTASALPSAPVAVLVATAIAVLAEAIVPTNVTGAVPSAPGWHARRPVAT